MDAECPYCGEEIEINHDDGYGYGEDVYQQDCCHCEKTFTFTTGIIYHHETEKAVCLNEGGEHDFKPSNTYPRQFTKMVCSICDKRRKPTDIELLEILKYLIT